MNLQHITSERVCASAADPKRTRRELSEAFDEGVLARRQGFPEIACWYPPDSEHRAVWLQGHAARAGGQYCVAGHRKRIAADAFPFAPGAVETHRVSRPLRRIVGRVIAWMVCAAIVIGGLAFAIGRVS
jgi:hypothetical protein